MRAGLRPGFGQQCGPQAAVGQILQFTPGFDAPARRWQLQKSVEGRRAHGAHIEARPESAHPVSQELHGLHGRQYGAALEMVIGPVGRHVDGHRRTPVWR